MVPALLQAPSPLLAAQGDRGGFARSSLARGSGSGKVWTASPGRGQATGVDGVDCAGAVVAASHVVYYCAGSGGAVGCVASPQRGHSAVPARVPLAAHG